MNWNNAGSVKAMLGQLYLRSCKCCPIRWAREKKGYSDSFLYDASSKSHNVHMIPADPAEAEKYAQEMREKYKDILDCIGEKHPGILERERTSPGSVQILKETPYEGAEYLFAYLRYVGKRTQTCYDLVFNRFYLDEEGKINCILQCFQVKMFLFQKDKKDKGEPPSAENYPTTCKPGEGNEVYHNLDVGFNESAEDIAKAFLTFVLDREEKAGGKEHGT